MAINAVCGPYVVGINGLSVTGAITLIQVKAGANRSVEIVRAWLSQSNRTASPMQRVEILRKTAAATVTGATPLLLNTKMPAADAAGGVAATGTNASVEGTDGDVLVGDAFNIQSGWLWVPTTDERIVLKPAEIIGLKLPVAPDTATVFSGAIVFNEY
jgi:hypothetical protein